MVDDNNNFLANVTVSGEVIFSLNSEVNSSNVMKYARYGEGQLEDPYIDLHKSGIK